MSIAFYQAPVSAAAALVAQSQGFDSGDPIGALLRLEEALKSLTELNRKATKTLEQVRTAHTGAERMEKAAQSAAQRRSQGFLLREPESNPEPMLVESRQHHAAAWQALNQADNMVAGAALEKCLSLADQAYQAVETHVAARALCESELPRCRGEARRLADLQSAAQAQQSELARDFAAESWSAVSQNLHGASVQLGSGQRLLSEAAKNAALEIQHYCLASRLLTEAGENHKQVELTLAPIGKRLRELIDARTEGRKQLAQARELADRTGRLLLTNSADRVQANERYRTAVARLERLQDESRLQRPDWPQLVTRTREIQTDLERAEQLAREDLKLAQQAEAEVAETERVMQVTRAFNESGFVADLATAERHLADARRRLEAQEFEEAIRLANTAEQEARGAQAEASAKAARRREQLQAERRNAEALVAPQSAPPVEAERVPREF